MKYFVYFLLFFCFPVFASDVTVGVKESPPFSFKKNNEWTGYSIELLKKIANDLKLNLSFMEVNTTQQLVELTNKGKVDLSISAISMTPRTRTTYRFFPSVL